MSSNRIPADKSSTYAAWDIPEVKKGQVVQAEKLRHRGPRGELVELSGDEIVYSSITAAQLEEISQAAYEEIREQARHDGFQQGRDEGYQAGLQAAQDELRRQIGGVQEIAAELMRFLSDQDDAVEQALVNLSICVASAILRRELTIDSRQVVEVVHEALKALPVNAGNIIVHVGEQDYELLRESDAIPAQCEVKVDPTLTPGGCRVTTNQSVVDYTLEDQFQQMVNGLVEQRFASLGGRSATSLDSEGEG